MPDEPLPAADDAGRCPFWDAVGRRFFNMAYPQAERLSGGDSIFGPHSRLARVLGRAQVAARLRQIQGGVGKVTDIVAEIAAACAEAAICPAARARP